METITKIYQAIDLMWMIITAAMFVALVVPLIIKGKHRQAIKLFKEFYPRTTTPKRRRASKKKGMP